MEWSVHEVDGPVLKTKRHQCSSPPAMPQVANSTGLLHRVDSPPAPTVDPLASDEVTHYRYLLLGDHETCRFREQSAVEEVPIKMAIARSPDRTALDLEELKRAHAELEKKVSRLEENQLMDRPMLQTSKRGALSLYPVDGCKNKITDVSQDTSLAVCSEHSSAIVDLASQSEWFRSQTKEAALAHDSSTVLISTSSLRKKIGKQKELIEKFAAANSRWEKYCHAQKEDYEVKMKSLLAERRDYRLALVESKRSQETLQKRVSELSLSLQTKLQKLEEHNAGLLSQLSEESERLATVLAEKDATTQELDTCRAERFKYRQLLDERKHTDEALIQKNSPVNLLREDCMKSKISLLQQQVAAFSEDFNNEKSDRERIQAQKVKALEQLDKLQSDYAFLQQKYLTTDRDLTRARDERRQLQHSLSDRSTELHHIKLCATCSWQCTRCTFANPPGRLHCDACTCATPFQLTLAATTIPIMPQSTLTSRQSLPSTPSAPPDLSSDRVVDDLICI